MIKLHALGGYGEYGRNMTALEFANEIIILDCGIKLQKNSYTETLKITPDFTYFQNYSSKIIAVIISHAHLDHCGALKEFLDLYNVPVYCSKYTGFLIQKLNLVLTFTEIKFNEKINIGNFELNAIEMQHSIPDSLLIKINVNEKTIIYASDFKLDYTPVIGKATDLKEIAYFCKNPDVLIVDTTRAMEKTRTKSEIYVKGMLEDLIGYYSNVKRNIFITTFASNISRIKSILKLSKLYKYELIVIGTAFDAYLYAAKKCNFISHIKIIKDVFSFFRYNSFTNKKYLFLVTGSQGEINSFLYRLARNHYNYHNIELDLILFSSSCIPDPITILQREDLILKLKQKNIKIIDNVHTSGHASMEDHIIFLEKIKPKIIIPTHSDFSTTGYYVAHAKNKNFLISSTLLILQNKQSIFL